MLLINFPDHSAGVLFRRFFFERGIRIVNVVPLPKRDLISMLPPWPVMICLQMDKPRPVPGTFPSEAWTRKNFWNR